MKNKKILALCVASCLGIASLFMGCNNNAKDDVDKAAEDVKDKVDDVGEGVKQETQRLVDKVRDKTMTYSEDDFEKSLKEKGIKVEEIDTEKSFFSVDSDDYLINNQRISVYEYEVTDEDKLNDDLATVGDNGMTINGETVTWQVKPHIYKKGRIVVLYDGNDEATLNTLNDILDSPIL